MNKKSGKKKKNYIDYDEISNELFNLEKNMQKKR
jgi:hypothetical protein